MQVSYPITNLKRTNLTQQETSREPQVAIEKPDGQYTLVMIDPDAGKKTPTNVSPGNSDRYYLHWLVVNIPSSGAIEEGVPVVPYQGPTPPPNTGQHRYHFILYKQSVSLTSGLGTKERAGWSLQGFLQGKGLTEVARQTVRVPQKLNKNN
jgi:phosphatidylethanolamine-binding protein (PEBP) family uncharacterized protein